MDHINLIENLIAAIESGDKDYMDETVGLAKLIVKAGAPAATAAPAGGGPAGGWIVNNVDDGEVYGPFVDEPTAHHWGQTNLDPIGVAWEAEALLLAPTNQSQQPQQQNLPPGYVSTQSNPGARIAGIPPGTLYRP